MTEIRNAAAIVLTTRTDDDPDAPFGATYVSSWSFMTVAKADQNAAWNAEKGRPSEVVTTCHDHGQPIVQALNLGNRWFGHCQTCAAEWERRTNARRAHRYAGRR